MHRCTEENFNRFYLLGTNVCTQTNPFKFVRVVRNFQPGFWLICSGNELLHICRCAMCCPQEDASHNPLIRHGRKIHLFQWHQSLWVLNIYICTGREEIISLTFLFCHVHKFVGIVAISLIHFWLTNNSVHQYSILQRHPKVSTILSFPKNKREKYIYWKSPAMELNVRERTVISVKKGIPIYFRN
jgi:hypothetical protein